MNVFTFKSGNYSLDAVGVVERFEEYAVRHIMSMWDADKDSDGSLSMLTNQYCSLSGYPYGRTHSDEFEVQIRIAIRELGLTDVINLLEDTKPAKLIDSIETVIDHLYVRNIVKSRPAPSLISMNNRLSIRHYSTARQLAILTNSLLVPTDWQGVEIQVERFERVIDIAEQAEKAIEDKSGVEAHAALIELDAKYDIRALTLTRKERAMLAEIQGQPGIDWAALAKLAVRIIMRYDEHGELEPKQRWTQSVYHSTTFDQAQRPERSNVLTGIRKKSELKTPAKESKSKVRSRDPKKQAIHDAFAGFAGLFKSVEIK